MSVSVSLMLSAIKEVTVSLGVARELLATNIDFATKVADVPTTATTASLHVILQTRHLAMRLIMLLKHQTRTTHATSQESVKV